MTKMGGFFANRLSRTMEHASPRLARRIARGKGLLNFTGQVLNTGDKAIGAASDALFAPGGEELGKGVDMLSQGIGKLPLRAKLLALGVPAYYAAKQDSSQNIGPVFNQAIEEGRQVYANDEEFLEKKAAQREKLAIDLTQLFQGIGHGLGAGADGFGQGMQAMHGLGSLAGEAVTKGGLGANAARGLAPGMMIGGGMAGLAGLIGGALKSKVTQPVQETGGYQMNRAMNPLLDRVKWDETMASKFFETMGSEAAKGISGLLTDVKSKAMSVLQADTGGEQMVETMMSDDPILSRGNPAQMINAYHTMAKFAPTLATDENAVRSFLRESVMAGIGPDYASISNLAKAEANIRNAMNPYPRKQD